MFMLTHTWAHTEDQIAHVQNRMCDTFDRIERNTKGCRKQSKKKNGM